MNELTIDKQNGNIAFSEEAHKYWDVTDPSKEFISVTTLIGKYEQPFDKEFVSFYKAMEKLLPEDSWAIEKKSLWAKQKIDKSLLEIYNIPELELNKVQQEILDEWQKINIESQVRGTKIHSELEHSMYNAKNNISLKKYDIGGKFECRKDYTDLDLEEAVYPEYLIYYHTDDNKLFIAGQIDLLVKSGNKISICDYKSNRKIEQKSFYNKNTKSYKMMKAPLTNIMDTNYWHYCLQLSTYAYMIQNVNPEFEIQDLVLIHFDHDDNMTVYHCPYLKDEVIKMINHYKKQAQIEAGRAKRKKIEY